MRYLVSATSIRRFILMGWAFAVIWIYLGNLINFHQHKIWGKQLIPVACYSTRAKEKEGLVIIKKNSDNRLSIPGEHFDFTTPDQDISITPFAGIISNFQPPADNPFIRPCCHPYSFRGPPSA